MSAVIKTTQDSIEFLTMQDTGESGMSLSGLSRLCGVTKQAVEDLLKSIAEKKVQAKSLAQFSEESLYLSVRGSNNERIIRDKVCAAIIDYYAFESKRVSQAVKDQSIFAYRRFAGMGVRAWIQGITGWRSHSTPLLVEDFVLKEPLVWNLKERPFPEEFYRHIYRLRGWDFDAAERRGHPGCVGMWTNQFVYDRFPDGVPESITEGYKAHDKRYRKYEFLTPDEGRRHLEKHMTALLTTMRLTPDGKWNRFLKNLDKAIPDAEAIRCIQLELSFLSEIEDELDDVDGYLEGEDNS